MHEKNPHSPRQIQIELGDDGEIIDMDAFAGNFHGLIELSDAEEDAHAADTEPSRKNVELPMPLPGRGAHPSEGHHPQSLLALLAALYFKPLNWVNAKVNTFIEKLAALNAVIDEPEDDLPE